MRFTGKHILVSGRVLLVLFLLANSGFTYVFARCAMSDAPEKMACCQNQEMSSTGSCVDMNAGQPADEHRVVITAPCMVTTLAGGLQTDPKIVEKPSLDQHLSKVNIAPATTPTLLNAPAPNGPFCIVSSAVSSVSLVSVEKYVLTSTFLI